MEHSHQIKELLPTIELNKSLLVLQPDEEALFKAETGITDLDKLKEHIYAVQEEAYKVYPFHCIHSFSFTRLKISRFPIYKQVLDLGSNRSDAILLDLGCCFGNDIRKIVRDGFPVENVIASDLKQEFWDLGHTLFNSTPQSFSAKFIAGDIFDSSHLALLEDNTLITPSIPPLQSLTSLNPLRNHVSAIHASSFFHLFDEPRQLELAHRLAGLLDQRPGSIIFGSHVALPDHVLSLS